MCRGYARRRSVTSRNSHDPHHADYCRIDRNKSGLNLLQRNTDDGQQNNGNVQLIPPGQSTTADIPAKVGPNKLQIISQYLLQNAQRTLKLKSLNIFRLIL